MRNIFMWIGIGMVLFIFIAASGVFGYMWYTQRADAESSKSQAVQLQSQLQEAQQQLVEQINSFIDVGMDVRIDFPSSWMGELNLELSADFAYDTSNELYGPIAKTYTYTLTKDNAQLLFTKILGGVGGNVFGLDPDNYDFKVLPGEELVRYREKGTAKWYYVSKAGCDEATNDLTADTTVCVGTFFPGFGVSTYAATATISADPAENILNEADQIVLSAQN